MPYADQAKRKEASRAYYLRRREDVIAASRARHERLKDDPAYKAKIIALKEKYRRAAGALPLEDFRRILADRRARNAAAKEERTAAAARLRAQRLLNRPWSAASLSPAERYVMRYRMDESFRRAEYQRHLAKKRRHRRWMAERNDDVEPGYVERMRATAEHCYLCGIRLDEVVRTVDHAIPLSRGGRHQKSNLFACCLSCNSKKGDRKWP
jgi:5-methylcytosine-specific restriction endonuclease McrA